MATKNENSGPAPSSDSAAKSPPFTNNQLAGSSNTRGNLNRRRTGDERDSKIILANPIGYEGDTPDVGAILALKHERFKKKVPFSQFVEKVYRYVLSNFKDRGDMKAVFKDFKDPLKALQANHMPTAIDNPSEIEKEIQRERIKQYVL